MTQSGTLKTMSIVESSSHFNVLKETDLVISCKNFLILSNFNSFKLNLVYIFISESLKNKFVRVQKKFSNV